jgi:DNA-directed RNA polymerase specialized sigma24 family protein
MAPRSADRLSSTSPPRDLEPTTGPPAAGPGAVRRPQWELSPLAFERFLQALHPDRNTAAERYEQIRSKLLRFFEWHGCVRAEELADETITRVIRKIDQGDRIEDPDTYCHGVARLVRLESFKHQEKEREALARVPPGATLVDEAELERRLECLRACMKALPADHQALIVEYHRYDGSERIDGRKRLAARFGIGLNALRIRAHRLSERLASCVAQSLRQRGLS